MHIFGSYKISNDPARIFKDNWSLSITCQLTQTTHYRQRCILNLRRDLCQLEPSLAGVRASTSLQLVQTPLSIHRQVVTKFSPTITFQLTQTTHSRLRYKNEPSQRFVLAGTITGSSTGHRHASHSCRCHYQEVDRSWPNSRKPLRSSWYKLQIIVTNIYWTFAEICVSWNHHYQ